MKPEVLMQFPATGSCYFKQNMIYCEKYNEFARIGTTEKKNHQRITISENFSAGLSSVLLLSAFGVFF